ncbi:MAG: winged helix-turn-helix domain-containing protein, partial [Promethearchaeota archaeon]
KRIKILGFLSENALKFHDIQIKINIERTALSNHLTFLKERDLITKISHGVYKITEDGTNLLKTVVNLYMKSKLQRKANQKKREELISQKYRRSFIMTKSIEIKNVVDIFNQLHPGEKTHMITVNNTLYVQPHVLPYFFWIIMKYHGWEIDYDEFMTVSGISALFGYERDEFLPKYAFRLIKLRERIKNATGFEIYREIIENAEDAWKKITQQITQKKPVIGLWWEAVLFTGFQEAEDLNDRKIYVLADGPDTFIKWWTWKDFCEWFDTIVKFDDQEIFYYNRKKELKSTKEIAVQVITDLINWSQNPPKEVQDFFPKASFGLQGIEKYAYDCQNVEEVPGVFGPCHGINPLGALRNSSGIYLTNLANTGVFSDEIAKSEEIKKPKIPMSKKIANKGIFSGKINRHLKTAGNLYKNAFKQWQKLYELLGHHIDDATKSSKEQRLKGANAIKLALNYEKEAIQELSIIKKLLQ